MTVDASIPKALYQANIELALRIAALLQENGKQWFDLFAEEASTRFGEGVSSLAGMGSGASLEKLAALPADAAARLLQLDVGRWQAVMSHAVENQTLFSEGLQDALRQWQGACSDAFDVTRTAAMPNLGGALGSLPGFSDVAMSFQRFMTQAVPSVGAVYSASVGSKAPGPATAAPASKPAQKPPGKKSAGKSAPTAEAAASARAQGKAARKPAAKAAPASVEKTASKATPPAANKSAATPRKASRKTNSTPVSPPKSVPALVTTPRKATKRAAAKSD